MSAHNKAEQAQVALAAATRDRLDIARHLLAQEPANNGRIALAIRLIGLAMDDVADLSGRP